MIYLIYEKQGGRVVSHIIADAEPQVMDHHATIEASSVPDFLTVRVINGALVEEIPADYLDGAKKKLMLAIDAARDARLADGAATPFGSIQADIGSRVNISGAVSMALLDPEFSVAWRMADNSIATLNATQMVAVGRLVGGFVNSVYQRSFELKAEVEALSTLAAVKAFVISFDAP